MENILKVALVFGALIGLIVLLPNILALSTTGLLSGRPAAVENLGTLSATAATEGATGVMAISFDGGETFKETHLIDEALPQNVMVVTSKGGADNASFGGRVFYAGTDTGLFISRDNGLTWYRWADLQRNIDSRTVIYDIEFDPYTNAIFVAAVKNNFGVVWRTDDDFRTVRPVWTEPKMVPYSLALHDGYILIGVSDSRVLSYDPDFDTFVKLVSFNSAVRRLESTFTNEVVAMLENGDIYRSSAPASTWTKIQSVRAALPALLPFFTSAPARSFGVTIDKTDAATYYLAAPTGLYKSTDRGQTWELVNTILPNNARIDSVAVYGDQIFVGSGSRLYRSADSGASWSMEEPLATNKRLAPIYVTGGGSIVVVGTRR